MSGVKAPVVGFTVWTFELPDANGNPPRVVTRKVPSARGTMLVGTGSVTGPPRPGKSVFGMSGNRVITFAYPVAAETSVTVFMPASTTKILLLSSSRMKNDTETRQDWPRHKATVGFCVLWELLLQDNPVSPKTLHKKLGRYSLTSLACGDMVRGSIYPIRKLNGVQGALGAIFHVLGELFLSSGGREWSGRVADCFLRCFRLSC